MISAYDSKRLTAGLKRLAYLGSAIQSVGRVVEVARTLGDSPPCPNCADLHADLTNGFIISSLNTAMTELGHTVGDLAEELENVWGGALRDHGGMP